MNPEHISIAQACLDGSHNGTITFPDVVKKLSAAGFEGYIVDFRQGAATYFLRDCSNTVLCMPPSTACVAAEFDANGIEGCVREAQRNTPGYSYHNFCEKVKSFGCAGYIVSFLGQRVVYYGRTAETHVEHFPQ